VDAEEDIGEAVEFYRRQYGEAAAESLLHSFYTAFQLLAEYPLIGRPRPDVRRDLRSFSIPSYVILYSDMEAHVYIARVLHQRRDVRKAFREKNSG
jgi:toxin ParE1/3/4